MKADLTAALVRSDFRAKKYDKRFREAVASALKLDPENPRPIVSSAKSFLFASPGRGCDLKEGIALLDRALALDPRIETAILLRARARDGLGDRAGRVLEGQGGGIEPSGAPVPSRPSAAVEAPLPPALSTDQDLATSLWMPGEGVRGPDDKTS
jgi:hypothetical protein